MQTRSPFDVCVCATTNITISSSLNQTHLFCIFDIYLVAFMLEIIMMTWTSWQVTASNSNSIHTNRNTLHILCVLCIIVFSPLCKCNCLLFVLLLILPYSLNIFKSIVMKPDGKWYYAQHWTNEQITNWKCFWRIYLDKICLFLIVV